MPQGGTGGASEKPKPGQAAVSTVHEKGQGPGAMGSPGPVSTVPDLDAMRAEQMAAWQKAAQKAMLDANPNAAATPGFDAYLQGWAYALDKASATPGQGFEAIRAMPEWQAGQVQGSLWKRYNPFQFQAPTSYVGMNRDNRPDRGGSMIGG